MDKETLYIVFSDQTVKTVKLPKNKGKNIEQIFSNREAAVEYASRREDRYPDGKL